MKTLIAAALGAAISLPAFADSISVVDELSSGAYRMVAVLPLANGSREIWFQSLETCQPVVCNVKAPILGPLVEITSCVGITTDDSSLAENINRNLRANGANTSGGC